MGMLCLRETIMNMIAESLQKKYKKEDKSMDANTYLPSARDVSDKDLSSSKKYIACVSDEDIYSKPLLGYLLQWTPCKRIRLFVISALETDIDEFKF